MANSNFHAELEKFLNAFRRDSHPMAMFSTLLSALSSYYPEQNPALMGGEVYRDKEIRYAQIYKLIGCAPAIVAAIYRYKAGLPINKPNPNLGYVENFLYMMNASHDN